MKDNFIKELLPRIIRKLEDKTEYPNQEFRIYVRWMRKRKGLDRKELSKRTELDENFLAFLENGNLYPDELTPKIQVRLSNVLGISFDTFMLKNRKLVEDWIKELEEFEKQSDEKFNQEIEQGLEDNEF